MVMTKLLRTSGECDIHIFEKPIAELLKYIVYGLQSAVRRWGFTCVKFFNTELLKNYGVLSKENENFFSLHAGKIFYSY